MAILTHKQLSEAKNHFFTSKMSEYFGLSFAVIMGLNLTLIPFLSVIIGVPLFGIAIYNLVKSEFFDNPSIADDKDNESMFACGLMVFSLMIMFIPLIAVPLGCYAMYRALPDNPNFEGKEVSATETVNVRIDPQRFDVAIQKALASVGGYTDAPPQYAPEHNPAVSVTTPAACKEAALQRFGLNLTDAEAEENARLIAPAC